MTRLFKKIIKRSAISPPSPFQGYGVVSDQAIKRNQGFSLTELLVSLFIITLIMLVVLPNFRAGQKSQEIDINLKQLVEGITSVQTKSLAGQLLVDGDTYPNGTTTEGYGIRFTKNQQAYETFAILPAYAADSKPNLPNNPQEIGNIKIVSLWGLVDPTENKPFPRLGQNPWVNFETLQPVNPSLEILEIIFSLPDSIIARPAKDGADNKFKYVGGIIEHVKSGKQGYFYVSLLSGAVNYGLY